MRLIVLALVAIINIALQISLPNLFNLAILPNTSLILVVCYSYLRSDIEGAGFGLFVGLLQDILFSSVLGHFALIYFIIGFVSNHLLKNIMNSNVLPIFLLTMLSSYIFNILLYFFTFFFKGRLEFFDYVYKIMIPESILNAVMSIPIFYLLFFINNKLEKREEKPAQYYSSLRPLK